MKSNKCIIPECYVDSCLIEVLLNVGRKDLVNHDKSNGRVAMKMKSLRFANEFCVGIIDEDRKQLNYLKEFGNTPELDTPYLRLWRHLDLNKHHYLIQIRPVIETWILDICRITGINLDIIPLPQDLRGLMKITKSSTARMDSRLIRLFKKMEATQAEPILQLKQWITYLKEKNFDADINDLKNA